MVDLNTSVRLAQEAAQSYGLTIIPGTEITRNVAVAGHYNALFTTDNNLVYDPNPIKAIQNAKAQGALIQHNHPGWRKPSLEPSDIDKQAYEQKLVDGVEVMNGEEFYPGIIDRCKAKNMFMSANTDIHATTSEEYTAHGYRRPMTLILAKDKSLESLREALEKQRTLTYGFGVICGEEKLLKDFFTASVSAEKVSEKKVMLTNKTSVAYTIKVGKNNPVVLPAFSSILLGSGKDSKIVKFVVLNMWSGADSHPEVRIKL